MKIEKFNEVVYGQFNTCLDVLKAKGGEYALGNDRLEHFKEAAKEQDTTPKQALWGMLSKHLASLNGMCKNGSKSKELWNEKITDGINYLLLLKALVEEDADEKD